MRYDVRVTVAGPATTPTTRPRSGTGARELSAGVIEVTAPCPTRRSPAGLVVFDPTRVVDGIELSDDPILRYRPAAYSESIARRSSS